MLCVVRLPQHGSDVLLTFNSPIFISERSAAAEHAGGLVDARWRERSCPLSSPVRCIAATGGAACCTPALFLSPPPLSLPSPAGAGFKGAHLTAPALFRSILTTFAINDWSLFGGGGGDGGGGQQ